MQGFKFELLEMTRGINTGILSQLFLHEMKGCASDPILTKAKTSVQGTSLLALRLCDLASFVWDGIGI